VSKEEYIRQLDRILAGIGRRFANARRGFRKLPVSGPEFFMLRHVADAGPARISALAQGLALDQSTVSNVVNSLEEKGLVEKNKDPDDRRVTLVSVTREGRMILEQVADHRSEQMRQTLGQLPEEDLAGLVRIFAKLRRIMETERQR